MKIKNIRDIFPFYKHNQNSIYFDSAASSLKATRVIDKVSEYDSFFGVNVHRGSYDLAYQATNMYEDARKTVSEFINAQVEEVVFTRGTTSSLNAIAHSYLEILKPGDEIITSELEHHSSYLPWERIAKITKAKIVFIPLTKDGRITVDNFKRVLSNKTKVVAVTYVSNVLGYVSPVKEIIKLAHQKNAIVILDAAQAIPHFRINVKDLDVDYLAFSGHKMFGPTGVGVLYGKKELLDKMEPFEYGGEMADLVYKDHVTYKTTSPYRLEAGTPVITGAIGLAEATKLIDEITYEKIHSNIELLREYTVVELIKIDEVILYNKNAETGIIAFNIKDVHPHDIATYLSEHNIAVRSGHHCAQLISRFLNVSSTLRVSFQVYNTLDECKIFIKTLKEAIQFFKKF